MRYQKLYWHIWFAWHPVRSHRTGRWLFLCKVFRKLDWNLDSSNPAEAELIWIYEEAGKYEVVKRNS